MKEKIAKKDIRQVLLDINPLVRQFHKNVIRFYTGVDPAKANGLGLEDSIDFLRRLWGSCLDWGNQRIDYIGDSVQQLSDFLNIFNSKEEIHDPQIFLEKLEKYRAPGLKLKTSTSRDNIVRLTELLQKFKSVGIKTAALIMRFLCLDCHFFEVDINRLIPPLDRVNYRMCKQLFGREYVLENFGKERASFGKKANIAFSDLGKYVLGEKKVRIDNLWFIGHFYHDASPQYKCKIREGAKIVDYPLLENVIDELSETCPFSEYGCKRPV